MQRKRKQWDICWLREIPVQICLSVAWHDEPFKTPFHEYCGVTMEQSSQSSVHTLSNIIIPNSTLPEYISNHKRSKIWKSSAPILTVRLLGFHYDVRVIYNDYSNSWYTKVYVGVPLDYHTPLDQVGRVYRWRSRRVCVSHLLLLLQWQESLLDSSPIPYLCMPRQEGAGLGYIASFSL